MAELTTRRRPGTRIAAGQLDLFAPSLDPELRRQADGLTCLRDSIPEAMHVVIHLADWRQRDERSISLSGDWAYSVRSAGIRFEHQNEWWGEAYRRGERYGWDRTPAQIITWDELATQLGSDPRRADILAWAAALPDPAWQELYRPHELWPNPGQWHPDYITGDHERPGWPERIAAWRALQEICTDAIANLERT